MSSPSTGAAVSRAATPGAGRPSDPQLTARILAATVELVCERGYSALHIEHVARLARCGKPAIYRRFADKAELVAAAALSVFGETEAADTGSLEDDLFAHASLNRGNQTQSSTGAEFAAGAVAAVFEPAVYEKLFERYFGVRRAQGQQIIARGVARGEIDPRTDDSMVLDTLAGLTLFRQTLMRTELSDAQLRGVIRALIATPPLRADATRRRADASG